MANVQQYIDDSNRLKGINDTLCAFTKKETIEEAMEIMTEEAKVWSLTGK